MMLPQRFQHVSSGGLALLVHGLLLLGLMIGVSWKIPPHLPIEADLWSELPAPVLAPPEYAPQPESLALPAPKPEPAAEADIALEKAEKKRQEELRQQEALLQEAQQKLEKKQAEEKRLEEKRIEAERLVEQQRIESERLEKERLEKDKREQNRRLLEQELARQEREALAAEAAQLQAQQNLARQMRTNTQTRTVLDFQDRIRNKIHNALVMPQSLRGDADVEFQVSLLPNGEVLRVNLVKTSGQPLYDRAVERAIFKASPLPLPSDRETARQFREGLTLKFRPSDSAAGFP